MWESTDGSCVLLVSSYSGPGLNPASVMLGDGGLPVLPSYLLPHQLIAGRKFEELGWGLQKQAGRTYRKQAMPGNVERESGKKTADCNVRATLEFR